MDKQYSVQFFATFVDNLQELCKSFLDFNQVVEVSGYVCVEIDNTKKERYVLSELVQSCGNVISESYCTKAFRTPGNPMSQSMGRQPARINPRLKENLNGRMGRPGQPIKQEKRPPPPHVGQPQNIRIGQHGQRAIPVSHLPQRPRNFGMRPPNSEREENMPPFRTPAQRRVFQQDDSELKIKTEKPDYYSDEGVYRGAARHKTRVMQEEWEDRETYVYRESIERVSNVAQRAGARPQARITAPPARRPQFAEDDEQSPGSESESEELSPHRIQQIRQANSEQNMDEIMDREQEWTGHHTEPEPEANQTASMEEFEIKPDLSLIKQEVEDPEYEASEMKAEDFPMPEEEFYAREKQMSFANRGVSSPKHPGSGAVAKPPPAMVAKHSPRHTAAGPSTSQQISMRSPDVGFARPQDAATVAQQAIDKSLLMIDEETDEFVEVDMDEFLEDEDLAELSQEMMEDSQLASGPPNADADEKEIKRYKSSLKNQRHAVKLFNDYQKKRGEGMKPIQTIHPERLDTLLSDFFLTVRKHNGQEFGPIYLRKIHSHLDRYLQDANYPFSIVKDDQFRHSNQILKDKIGELKARSKGGPVTITPITEDDVSIMFEAGEIGGCNPDTLLNTMWFVNSYFFGIKPADHFNLTWGDLNLTKDEDGHELLECPGGKFQGGKIFADRDDPERCYVRLYKRYRDKRPPRSLESEAPFYLTPNRVSRADSVWYSLEHATVNRLNGIFKKIAAVCGLQDKKMP